MQRQRTARARSVVAVNVVPRSAMMAADKLRAESALYALELQYPSPVDVGDSVWDDYDENVSNESAGPAAADAKATASGAGADVRPGEEGLRSSSGKTTAAGGLLSTGPLRFARQAAASSGQTISSLDDTTTSASTGFSLSQISLTVELC